ncbi:MAG: glycosyltransferase N-terminal domain-containing protein [Verrucomicrobiota bacterium]
MWRRGHFADSFVQRWALYSASLKARLKSFGDPLWIHAVSVGEMLQAKVLVEELRKRKPDLQIVITTTTATGKAVGKELIDEKTFVLYTPFDFLWCIKSFYQVVNPKLIILVEQELWPNLIWEARGRQIPVWVVNARVSEKSANRMQRFRFLLRYVIGEIEWVGVQDEREIERMTRAGFHRHVIFPVGSLKFEVASLGQVDMKKAVQIRECLAWNEKDPVLFAGSTHLGEEEGVIKYYLKAKETIPKLRLVIAPRHVERLQEIITLCKEHKLAITLRSECQHVLEEPNSNNTVLIVDTTGELRDLYHLGSIVFVGKSLHGQGGQNFLEPTRLGKAVVVGPHMQNFPYLTEIFVKNDGLKQVANWEGFEKMVNELLSKPQLVHSIGKNAMKLFAQEMRAGQITAEAVIGALEHST